MDLVNKSIVVISKYFNPSNGGGERQLNYFLKSVQNHYNVDVLTAQNNPTLPTELLSENINLWRFNGKSVEDSFNGIYKFLLTTAHNYDFAYLVAYQKIAVCTQSKIIDILNKKKVKIIVRFSSYGEGSEFLKQGNQIEFFSKVDRIISLSQSISEELLSLGCSENKIFTFKNPVDLSLFYPGRRRENKSRIVVLSRPHPKKKWLEIIEAWNEVTIKGSLTFVYNDNESQYMRDYLDQAKSYAQRLNSSESIYFDEDVNMEEVPEKLREFDIMISASINEGMQNSLLEALASGLSVISPLNKDYDYLNFANVYKFNKNNKSLTDTIEYAMKAQSGDYNSIKIKLLADHNITNYIEILEKW